MKRMPDSDTSSNKPAGFENLHSTANGAVAGSIRQTLKAARLKSQGSKAKNAQGCKSKVSRLERKPYGERTSRDKLSFFIRWELLALPAWAVNYYC